MVVDKSIAIYQARRNFGNCRRELVCGKSTLCKLIVRLKMAKSGNISLKGNDVIRISERKMKGLRSSFQMIFQDPYSTLNSQKKKLQHIG